MEFEQKAGFYTSQYTHDAQEQLFLDSLFNLHQANIARGVNTYWLSEPLRLAFIQKHNIYAEGGDDQMRYGFGVNYNRTTGVMKESSRDVLGGNLDLTYRKGKFQFANKLSINYTNALNPTVPFSEYARANPYYRKTQEDGSIGRYLESYTVNGAPYTVANPLWNASLNSRNEGKDLTLSNYFIAEYFPKHEWRFRARFGITYGNDDTEVFISPDDTRYDDVEIIRKGSYTATNTRLNQYEGEVSATFAKLFGKHQVNLVLGGNIYSSKSLTQGYSAQGFPEGDFTYPSFSNGYPENGSPTYYESVSRSVNAYFNAGYVFDDRYLMDFSLFIMRNLSKTTLDGLII